MNIINNNAYNTTVSIANNSALFPTVERALVYININFNL